MKIKTILLDMDGVCCNFVKAACEAHRKDYDELISRWVPGEGWNFFEQWGINDHEFWEEIDIQKEFWSEMDQLPWFEELIDLVEEHSEEFVFMTSPSEHYQCQSGKAAWLQERGFCSAKDALMGSRKDLLARPGTVLIDDNDRNCRKFREAGGQAIVFPQQWNASHMHQEDRMIYVERKLKEIANDH